VVTGGEEQRKRQNDGGKSGRRKRGFWLKEVVNNMVCSRKQGAV